MAKRDTKKLFRKKGTCSQTFFFIINREFSNNDAERELATDPLAGGIMQLGHQCGLLIGSTLAIGRRSYELHGNGDDATALAILVSKDVNDAFVRNAGSGNCQDITKIDPNKKLQIVRMILAARTCFNLADKWTEDALECARVGFSRDGVELPKGAVSCASEVAKMMGASDEDVITVAGLAGGLGLSGEACGALIASVWLNTLLWNGEHEKKSSFSNDYANNAIFSFTDVTGNKFLCKEICGREFSNVEEHSQYIREGGCANVIEALSRSYSLKR